MVHDGKLALSTGKDRFEKSWQNKEVLWSDLVKKLSTTHYTAETHAEYIAATKTRQDEIKDIGGFVGGHILKGRRKNGNILYRSIVTLDIDFANSDMWEDFTMMYTEAAAIYTTHKHSTESPRYRLIIPLNRQVLADEYEAISRKIAGVFDIEIFDRTTFQPARLMYWPSTSKGSDYFYAYQDGPFMDADKILSQYRDWTDTTQWPTSAKDFEAAKRNAKKQGDPTAKDGLIGAFCRTYTIHEAIEKFLSDVYTPTDQEDRYTYVRGSTSGGLVIYDDLYAFSHHGTDPAGNNLCNAFDLVRVHLFGLKDEDAEHNTPTHKLPSYKEMLSFAGADGPTRQTVGSERFESAQEDFTNVILPLWDEAPTVAAEPRAQEKPAEVDLSWMEKLEVEKKGGLKQSIYNGALILENDSRLNKCFGYDEFSQRKVIRNNLPWRKVNIDHQYLKDEDEAALRLYLERSYGLTSRMAISDALDTHIFKRAYHPIRNYLDGLKWDGRPRLDRLLIKYMGAEDNDYVRAVTRKTFTAAVARIYCPGLKFDYVLTIAGEEGKGKSTLIRKLGGLWFSDNFNTVMGKEAMEQVQGNWLIEMGEMGALKRAEIYSVKQFVSKQEDSFRPAYGRNTIFVRRQCIFFATTNEVEFLRGADGNRRFWIVDIHGRKAEADILAEESVSEDERAQIWAEAKMRFLEGEKLYLDEELELIARQEQKIHGEQDDRLGIIQQYLEMKLPATWEEMSIHERKGYMTDDIEMRDPGIKERTRVCITEIWVEALGLLIKDLHPYNARPIHDLLRHIPGWAEYRKGKLRFGVYGPQKAYIKEAVNVLSDGQ
jgi:putative DNA primase/helicase